jgi:ribonuclease HI
LTIEFIPNTKSKQSKKQRRQRALAPAQTGQLTLFTDGAAVPNPGRCTIAYIITDDSGEILAKGAEPIGFGTNNQAEYRALIRGLSECAKLTSGSVRCVSDSELMVRQLAGHYRAKQPELAALLAEARHQAARFAEVAFLHRRRADAFISHCDALAGAALMGNNRSDTG